MKRIILFTFYFLLFTFYSKAQVNLVSNPSFEQLDSCPTYYNQLFLATGWDTLLSGGGRTPDILTTCSLFPALNVPENSFGYQVPRSGNNYALQSVFYLNDPSRTEEYIQNKLIMKLVSGNNYCVSWFVSLAEVSKYAIDNYGGYLDNGSISDYFGAIANVTPHVKSQNNQYLLDTLYWIKIEGSFIANGTEEYLTLGNFRTNLQTNYISAHTSFTQVSGYYIDDVSVIDINTPAYAGVDTTITIGDSIFIGRTPEVGLNEDCVWYVNGNPIDTIAGLWVMPDSTTTYILEQTICGYTTYDTVTVTVLPTHINELFNENTVSIYPNPTNGNFTLSHNLNVKNYNLEIIDITGKVVHREKIITTKQQINTQQLSKGLYFLNFKSETGEFMYSTKMSVVK